jgi:CrcB protein
MKKYAYIAVGGMLGALARYGIKVFIVFPGKWDFPINTLMVNLTGCFLIALVLTASMDYMEISAELRMGITTGFIGAFTTFSTLCRETFQLLSDGRFAAGLIYPVLSVVLGLGSAFLGVMAAHVLFRVRSAPRADSRNEEDGNPA